MGANGIFWFFYSELLLYLYKKLKGINKIGIKYSFIKMFLFQIISLWKWKLLSHVRLCNPMYYTAHGILQASILSRTARSSSLLQGIFPTHFHYFRWWHKMWIITWLKLFYFYYCYLQKYILLFYCIFIAFAS